MELNCKNEKESSYLVYNMEQIPISEGKQNQQIVTWELWNRKLNRD